MKKVILALVFVAVSTSAFAATATLNCTPVNGSNTSITVNSLFFTQGSGTGSFTCSDSSLGAIVLSSISVSMFTDFTAGNGNANDPNDNSARFTFTNAATTWGTAQAGASATTMNLGTGVTLFSIGNLSSAGSTFTNTTSGGLGGTSYLQPGTDNVTGTLLDTLSISVAAFVDAGGFSSGASDARVTVTYSYSPVTTPEPASMFVVAGGLLAISFVARKKVARRS